MTLQVSNNFGGRNSNGKCVLIIRGEGRFLAYSTDFDIHSTPLETWTGSDKEIEFYLLWFRRKIRIHYQETGLCKAQAHLVKNECLKNTSQVIVWQIYNFVAKKPFQMYSRGPSLTNGY